MHRKAAILAPLSGTVSKTCPKFTDPPRADPPSAKPASHPFRALSIRMMAGQIRSVAMKTMIVLIAIFTGRIVETRAFLPADIAWVKADRR